MTDVFAQAPTIEAGRGDQAMLAPEEVQRMLALSALGWGSKRISEELGYSRSTVREYLRQGGWRPMNVAARSGALEAHREWLIERLRRHRGNAGVVRQDLQRELGISVSLRTVERAVEPLRRELRAVAHDTATSVVRRNMPDPVPVLVLGRLAVDRQAQGMKLGSALLQDAVRRAIGVSANDGIRALLVHAPSERAEQFYVHYGLQPSMLHPMTSMMRLPTRSSRSRSCAFARHAVVACHVGRGRTGRRNPRAAIALSSTLGIPAVANQRLRNDQAGKAPIGVWHGHDARGLQDRVTPHAAPGHPGICASTSLPSSTSDSCQPR